MEFLEGRTEKDKGKLLFVRLCMSLVECILSRD